MVIINPFLGAAWMLQIPKFLEKFKNHGNQLYIQRKISVLEIVLEASPIEQQIGEHSAKFAMTLNLLVQKDPILAAVVSNEQAIDKRRRARFYHLAREQLGQPGKT